MSAMEKRKSGMRRIENTPQIGSSPASNTKTRYHEASDPREENIVENPLPIMTQRMEQLSISSF
jgi:hypothetical protein